MSLVYPKVFSRLKFVLHLSSLDAIIFCTVCLYEVLTFIYPVQISPLLIKLTFSTNIAPRGLLHPTSLNITGLVPYRKFLKREIQIGMSFIMHDYVIDCDYRRVWDSWLDLLHALMKHVTTFYRWLLHTHTHTHTHTHKLVSTITSSLPLLGRVPKRTFPFLWVSELPPSSAIGL
jgi:hypothetical protein